MKIKEAIRLAENKGDWKNSSEAYIVYYDKDFCRHEVHFVLNTKEKEKEIISLWDSFSDDLYNHVLALRGTHY